MSSSRITIAISHPIGANPGTGRQTLGDRSQGLGGADQHVFQPSEGEAVDDLLAPTLSGNEAAMAQASKVRADTGLGLTDQRDEFSNGALVNCKKLKDLKPGGISENAEKPCGRRWVNASSNVGTRVIVEAKKSLRIPNSLP